MTKRHRQKNNGPARPIKSKRDYERASTVVKRLSGQKSPDSTAELRLQSLLRELDKYEDAEEDAGQDDPGEQGYTGPRRRWSDDASGGE